jgi:hypothetical protein
MVKRVDREFGEQFFLNHAAGQIFQNVGDRHPHAVPVQIFEQWAYCGISPIADRRFF